MRNHPSARAAAAVLTLGAAVTGCGAPPELDDPPPPPPPPASPTAAGPTGAVPVLPTGLPPPATPSDPDDLAVSCGGDPDGDDLIALLRAEDVLAQGTDASVTDGPLCAGGWQYAVVSVPDLDPLQVVTRQDGGELELVTAGTDVCTVDVRVHAPPGIRTVAACVG